MSTIERAPRPWTLSDFLVWEARQSQRYELVGGRAFLMAGGSQAHDAIAINLTSALKALLRGSPCRPGSSDLRVVTGNGNVRYPDATVDCGPFRPDSNDASEPRIVFEVLSKSTRWTDFNAKLRDYDRTPTILGYFLVSQDEPSVATWIRGDGGHLVASEIVTDLAASIELPSLGIALALAAIYDGLAFEADAAKPGG